MIGISWLFSSSLPVSFLASLHDKIKDAVIIENGLETQLKFAGPADPGIGVNLYENVGPQLLYLLTFLT